MGLSNRRRYEVGAAGSRAAGRAAQLVVLPKLLVVLTALVRV